MNVSVVSLAVQYLVIALAVLASAMVVVQKQWPGASRRLRVAVALPLLRTERRWLQAIGRCIAPTPRVDAGGCIGCGGCGDGDSTAS